MIAQVPAGIFDYVSNVKRLREKRALDRKSEPEISYPDFTIRDGDASVSLHVTWDIHFERAMSRTEQYRVYISLNGKKESRYYIAVYDFNKGEDVPLSVGDSIQFYDELRPRGIAKALRSLILKGVPLIHMQLANIESDKILNKFNVPYEHLAHSQMALTHIGRITPNDYLWDYDGGFRCINFDQFGLGAKAYELQDLFRQATDIEMAYYGNPSEINLTSKRQLVFRGKFLYGNDIRHVAQRLLNFIPKLEGPRSFYNEDLARSIRKQFERLNILANNADRAMTADRKSSIDLMFKTARQAYAEVIKDPRYAITLVGEIGSVDLEGVCEPVTKLMRNLLPAKMRPVRYKFKISRTQYHYFLRVRDEDGRYWFVDPTWRFFLTKDERQLPQVLVVQINEKVKVFEAPVIAKIRSLGLSPGTDLHPMYRVVLREAKPEIELGAKTRRPYNTGC